MSPDRERGNGKARAPDARAAPDVAWPARDGCPDANLLAGFIDGTLTEVERAAIEAHVARCGDCREIVAPIGERTAQRGRGRLRRSALAVTALVVAAIAAWLAWGRGLARADDPRRDLVAAASDLSGRHPELFASFRPLDEAAIAALARPRVARGGVEPRCIEPSGKVLETRPRFVARGAAIRVQLCRRDGAPLWESPLPPAGANGTSELAFPPGEPALEPGAVYLWYLGPAGQPALCAADFEVANEAERERYRAASDCIERETPAHLRPRLRAHFAISMGLVDEARRLARQAGASDLERALGGVAE